MISVTLNNRGRMEKKLSNNSYEYLENKPDANPNQWELSFYWQLIKMSFCIILEEIYFLLKMEDRKRISAMKINKCFILKWEMYVFILQFYTCFEINKREVI